MVHGIWIGALFPFLSFSSIFHCSSSTINPSIARVGDRRFCPLYFDPFPFLTCLSFLSLFLALMCADPAVAGLGYSPKMNIFI